MTSEIDEPPADAAALADYALGLAVKAAEEAGDIALRDFRHGEQTTSRIWSKAGGSPVTEADVTVDTFLKIRLSQALPEAGWLSEETVDDHNRLSRRLVWIVDPIDGTRAFLSGHPDWCVSIALHADNVPIAGVLFAPALGVLYTAKSGGGAMRNGELIEVGNRTDLPGALVSGPRPATDALAHAAPGIRTLPKIPSLALRLARVADGSIDAALVSADARDWDLAAVDLILTEAGGTVTSLQAARPAYNGRDPRHDALIASSLALHGDLLDAARRVAAVGALVRAARDG